VNRRNAPPGVPVALDLIREYPMSKSRPAALVLCVLLLAGGCATESHTAKPVAPTAPSEVGEVFPGFLKGYLQSAEVPDSLALLPAPPVPGSPAQAADDAEYHALAKFLGTPRGALAVSDADLSFPHAAGTFSCALGVPISQADTPNLNMLLRRTLADAGLATYKAKTHYQRTRPFVQFSAPSCTPAEEAFLAKDGSYPSGHSAIGWAWALTLTELAPERADAILQRGRAFGQSRAICGVHWQSDVESGRAVGAAVVARLHTNALFSAQLEAARTEIARQRSAQAPPIGDCAVETATIATSSSIAP
jgi:acid phosphatase (class A)